jgi:hypothetical protein
MLGSNTQDAVWIDIIALVMAVSLLEAAVTGRWRNRRGPHRPVVDWARPVLALTGFALLVFAVFDSCRRYLK